MVVRVQVCLNAGPRAGQPQAAIVVAPLAEALIAAAANKLRLKKRDVARARAFVWGTGIELAREGSCEGQLCNGDLVAISMGEAYAGPIAAAAAAAAASVADGAAPGRWLRWQARSESLAVVEWSDARTMNETLGRVSTLLEHPLHCGSVVSHDEQRRLPSSGYLGHNLYEHTLCEFERLAGADASGAEAGMLAMWRARGAPRVVVSFVSGATSTLRHELCHARFALDDGYRMRCTGAWEARAPQLAKYLRDLGYHPSRHADEFGAYVLTEPTAFWRGRISPAEAKALREEIGGPAGGPAGGPPGEGEGVGEGDVMHRAAVAAAEHEAAPAAEWSCDQVDPSQPVADVSSWWGREQDGRVETTAVDSTGCTASAPGTGR